MTLSGEQWRFIAARLLCSSDKEAAEQVSVHPSTVGGWKMDSEEFRREYEASFTDGVEVAKNYTRKMLGKAAQRLNEALDATALGCADHRSRIRAAELLFKAHGLLQDRLDVTSKGEGITLGYSDSAKPNAG